MSSESVTIYDIASEAGVSIATVSRVLRGETNVSEATRKKVQDVIDRRNYRPSSIARGLTSKTTHSLGIILPKLLNPHYAMIFTGAQEEARSDRTDFSSYVQTEYSSKNGLPRGEANDIAQTNDGVLSQWQYLEATIHRRHRCYRKLLG